VKAAVCRVFGAPLEIEELRLDPPEPGEVRVRVAACAICHSDVHFTEGAWGGELPAVAGHEAAGVVEEVGRGVTGVRPGDRVVVSLLRWCGRCFFCARGESHLCETALPIDRDFRLRTPDGKPVHQAMRTAAFAEEVVVHESQLAVIPSSLAFDVASLIGCGVLTGLGAVTERAGVTKGASVVVVGTGGVGLNAVQGAVIAGARHIVGIDVSPGKREAAVRFGATHTVDPAAGDPGGEIRALTGGRGADYVLVTVASTDAIEQSLSWLRRGGTLVVVGMPRAGEKIGVVAVDLAHDDLRIVGSKMGSARLAEAVPRIVDLYEQGRLRLDELVSGRYPLERINEAIAAAGEGSALRNVIVFDPV
jgi:Zn-dependent alcohol dehydrogenase